ncbi:hypothetical protein ACOKM5_20860 [Streptomyces sp. BH097]|uniref:hypothetical protein n=1 Tax=Streptomyces sp. BH097 TaxID=3410406 RepID=UPI003CE9F5E5
MIVPSIVAVAVIRVARSEDPEKFELIVALDEVDARHGVDIMAAADSAWNTTDPVRTAAEVEVLAGLRRIAAATHPTSCWCDACRVRRALTPKTKGGAG